MDESDLSAEEREALEADDFVIYGRASVEEYDEDNPPQKIVMEAFADEIDQYVENGIISRRHKDIPVGEPIGSYTLEDDREVAVDDELLTFDAGDTLETGIRDGEVWIVANLRNDSEIARETRLGAMTGDLTGFSVTVFTKGWEQTDEGERVTDIDWHSTTIGGDQHIKNPDSRFGVAEYKAVFSDHPNPADAAAEVLEQLPDNMSSNTDEKGFWDRVRTIADQKSEAAGDGPPDGEEDSKADTPSDHGPPGSEESPGEHGASDDEETPGDHGVDAEAVLKQVEENMGEEHAAALKEQMYQRGTEGEEADMNGDYADMNGDYEEDDDDDGDDDDDDDDDDAAGEPNSEAEMGELKAVADKMEEMGFVRGDPEELKASTDPSDVVSSDAFAQKVAEKLEERLPDGEVATKSDLDGVIEAAEEAVNEVVPEAQKAAVEGTAEKMVTGSTDSPAAGSDADTRDYKSDIQERFASVKGGEE
mgnify:CR=1 FL=1